jgi:exosortase/archaeosortase family protein
VAFVANIVRVMILVLVTYHLGDAAGQGFVHDFAGIVLFVVALSFMLVLDRLLGLVFPGAREVRP